MWLSSTQLFTKIINESNSRQKFNSLYKLTKSWKNIQMKMKLRQQTISHFARDCSRFIEYIRLHA
jgi:hypothetical protein